MSSLSIEEEEESGICLSPGDWP